jgi:hypothetical protein
VAAELTGRWDGLLDRVSLAAPSGVDEACWAEIHAAMQGLGKGALRE